MIEMVLRRYFQGIVIELDGNEDNPNFKLKFDDVCKYYLLLLYFVLIPRAHFFSPLAVTSFESSMDLRYLFN